MVSSAHSQGTSPRQPSSNRGIDFSFLTATLLLCSFALIILGSIVAILLNYSHQLPIYIDIGEKLRTIIIPILSIGLLGAILTAILKALGKIYQNPTVKSLIKELVILAILFALVTVGLLGTIFQLLPKQPSFDDPLDHFDSQWQTSNSDGNTFCSFPEKIEALDAKIIANGTKDWSVCYVPAPTYTDFKYQVQMTILQGDFGGIVFRGSGKDNNSNFYYFAIGTDGEYVFQKAFQNHVRPQDQPIATGYTPAYRNLLSNKIEVLVHGTTFQFLVNDKSIPAVNDSSLTQGGYIGVIADNVKSQTTEVLFSNATVWLN